MVWDKPQDKMMTDWDWHVLGCKERCPRKRIDVPLPYSTGGISELEVLFSYFVKELGEIRRTPGKNRYKISMVKSLYEDMQARCREKQRVWKEELGGLDCNAVESGATHHSGAQARNAERIDLKGLLGR